jgi:hypothetical protein
MKDIKYKNILVLTFLDWKGTLSKYLTRINEKKKKEKRKTPETYFSEILENEEKNN